MDDRIKTELYGVDVHLRPSHKGHVTDVVVLARTVWFDDDGEAQDSLIISTAMGTTGLLERAMISTASEIMAASYAYDLVEGDDDE